MATFCVITKPNNYDVIANFNAYYSNNVTLDIRRTYRPEHICTVHRRADHVSVYMENTDEIWNLTHDKSHQEGKYFIIEEILGVVPQSLDELEQKILELKQPLP